MSDARIADRVRSRPLVDKLMLAAALIALLVGLGRFLRVAAVAPYAAFNLQQQAATAREAGEPLPEKTVAEVFAKHRYFRDWWGGRRVPYRAGGDYLAVVENHSANRTLGTVLATVVERELRSGVSIEEVIVPKDTEALLGVYPGTSFVGADGVTFRNAWASIARAASNITEVPVVERGYRPLLSQSEATELLNATRLTSKTDRFLIAEPVPNGSGTWILHSIIGEDGDSEKRTFILMPVELSPAGDQL